MIVTKPAHILVPTDFSETASHALRYASGVAKGLGARVTLLYCDLFMPPIDYSATVGSWDDQFFVQLRERAEEQLRLDAQLNIDESVPFETVVRIAAPLEGILHEARQSKGTLIVMGTHGRTGFRRVAIGSITEAVMRRAEVPVIAVAPRSSTTTTVRTIVCPVVYNAQCLDALMLATEIAEPDARFILIRPTPADDTVRPGDDLLELCAWVPSGIANRFEMKLFGEGHMARQIELFAKSVHADLIVASEPSSISAAGVLRGTFAERLVPNSTCPVLTVNPSAALMTPPARPSAGARRDGPSAAS
jgi:nucleotide-binding universal stress UspA family protein